MSIRNVLNSDQLLISVVAGGITTSIIEGVVPSKVIRAMPNIGIVIERGG